jgi:divalent metal cation (Fe/Co/Zn/Cd) transporter
MPSSPLMSTLLRRALWLVGLTLAYNVVEACIAIWAGTAAGSIALLGFGLDSGIECAASAVLLWRLSVELRGGDEERVEAAERRSRRFVGLTFLALAAYVVVEAALTLLSGDHPAASLPGIVLAAISLVVMPLLAWAKLRTARQLGSGALEAEAKETLACAYLSFTLLVGLVLNAVAGWWWADPVAALAMVPWLLREGVEGVRGEE